MKKYKQIKEARLHTPLKGHDYHYKSDAELHYIAKDAHEAMTAIGTHDQKAAGKYADQVNDAASIIAFRKKGGKQLIKASNKKIQEAFNVAFNEDGGFKVGDVVVPDKGPHVGVPHEVVHLHGNGQINIRPKGIPTTAVKYRLGSAVVHPNEIQPHLPLSERKHTGINREVVQEAFKEAKKKKSPSKDQKGNGEKIEVKGPGPEDRFQKDPVVTPLTTAYTKG